MLAVVVIIFGICVKCNCDNNVERIYESRGISSKFHEIVQNNHFDDSRCVLDIIDTFDAVTKNELWALKMLDASGKLQSGILTGNIINLGSFTECMSIKANTSSNNKILGKYCLAFLFMTYVQRPNITYGLPPELKNLLAQSSGIPVIQAICLPDSCTAQEMTDLLNLSTVSEMLPVNIIFDQGYCLPEENFYEFTALQWFTLMLFIGTLVLMFLSTTYELYLLKLNSKPYHDILITYSLISNIKQLYRVRKDPDQLSCINGIRTLSMMWIILGHKYLIYVTFPHVNYLQIYQEWLKETSTSLILGGVFSVDTFFLISGLLIVYVILLAKAKEFNFNLIYYYMHRNFRLTPAFVMAILFYMTFLRYTSNGPVWPLVHRNLETACYNNWWYSMLYIQNYLDLEDICVNQSWYLAVDTQLYCLAPLLFLPLQRWPKRTITVAIILLILSCFFGFSTAWIYEINGRTTENTEQYHSLYCTMFYRCHSWLTGSLLGYYLFLKRGQKVNINKIVVIILWILSIFTMLSMVLMEEYFYHYEYNKWITSLYYGFSKLLWCFALSWIIFACVHGHGGLVNTFLSMKLFMIVGRLTYSMYIVHIVVLAATIFSGETNSLFSNSTTLYEYMSDLIIVIFIAHIWTLAFESPMISIGKILMPQELSKKLTAIHEDNENVSNIPVRNYNTSL